MSWIGDAACLAAQKHSEVSHVVTDIVDQIQFFSLLRIGDQVLLTASTDFVSNSTMEISVLVERDATATSERQIAARAFMTFVAMNSASQPLAVPRLVPESDSDLIRYNDARIRVKIRRRMNAWLKERPTPELRSYS